MIIIINNSDKSFAITDMQLPWWATAEDIENLHRAINDYISDHLQWDERPSVITKWYITGWEEYEIEDIG